MDDMRLKLNPDKTEFSFFGNSIQLQKCITSSFCANGEQIPLSEEVKCLGVFLDRNINFKSHCKNQARKAMCNFIKIRNIRNYLTLKSTEVLVLGLVMSHIDYCNSILYGLPEVTIKSLQRIQNMCAKLVLRRMKISSSSDALRELHWLPIRKRIYFKD